MFASASPLHLVVQVTEYSIVNQVVFRGNLSCP